MPEELTPEEEFNLFMDQQRELMNKANNPMGNVPQGNVGVNNQQGLTPTETAQLRALQSTINAQTIDPTKNAIKPSQGECPECGTFHPPLAPGEKCPMANADAKIQDGEQTTIIRNEDINKFLVDMKNIILSNIQAKKIKKVIPLFQKITLELAKFLENYKEE